MKNGQLGMIETITEYYGDFGHFIHCNEGKVFRYWIYRRMFTSYEEKGKYVDESVYEDTICTTAYIKQCIALQDGDYLIGFEDIDSKDNIQYCKLSEIRLECCAIDQDDYEDE